VMFGRSTYGRPWWPGVIAEELSPGSGMAEPSIPEERDIVLWHQEETLRLYGHELGNKIFRKHWGWTLSRLELRGLLTAEEHMQARATYLSTRDNGKVTEGIRAIYGRCLDDRAAA
jgi:tRNA-dihydrouridine synthase B